MDTTVTQFPEPTSALYEQLLACTGASGIESCQTVQSLWSGYGKITRCHLRYADHQRTNTVPSVVIKYIQPPALSDHPRGWNTDASQQRKLESYRVEANWYRRYAIHSTALLAMPRLYTSHATGNEAWLILEDLDTRFPVRKTYLSAADCQPCLQWLARFHAHYLESDGAGLWPIGTYWHLQTRQDEFEAMANSDLKLAAVRLDERLNSCRYQTLVHGDAKLANVCFPAIAGDVAMVDFQYVGRGCGIRDVAYFLGSCLNEAECERYADHLLDSYFDELKRHVPDSVKLPIEHEWRAMYPTAWADFHRFLAGWMPGHQKIHRYTRSMTRQALAELE